MQRKIMIIVGVALVALAGSLARGVARRSEPPPRTSP